MPELPEAETIARGLMGPVRGARILGLEVIHPDIVEGPPESLRQALVGCRVAAVSRRGKNLVLALVPGPAGAGSSPLEPKDRATGPGQEGHLVVNLGMSGRLLWRGPGDLAPPPTHPALRIAFATGQLVYHDPRRFGRIRFLTPAAWRAWSRTLGPEPLSRSFTAAGLHEALSRSRSPLRSWLLDQRKVAGVGNIYASEACHLARLHPRLPANRVDEPGGARLHRAIRKVLGDAVERGGTTLRDYRTAEGWEGTNQHHLRVYGREGEPCPRCGEGIVRVVFSNRSAFFCPRCQPGP
jgi:formamidopyrimidine-DNA glycosylase